MSDALTLPAEARERAGKGASRVLRREGRVPAVIYGGKEEPVTIHVEAKELIRQLGTGHFMNSIVMIDVGGKKVRTLGADVPKMYAAVGAVPVSLTTPELYEALQRGTVDYVSIPTTHTRTLKLSEVGKHACGPIFMLAMGHTTAINLDTWKKLPADIQKTILELARDRLATLKAS